MEVLFVDGSLHSMHALALLAGDVDAVVPTNPAATDDVKELLRRLDVQVPVTTCPPEPMHAIAIAPLTEVVGYDLLDLTFLAGGDSREAADPKAYQQVLKMNIPLTRWRVDGITAEQVSAARMIALPNRLLREMVPADILPTYNFAGIVLAASYLGYL